MSKNPKAKTYILKKAELEQLIINYAAHQLGMDAPFVHKVKIHGSWIIPSGIDGVITITLEPVANVLPFRPLK